MFCVFGRDFWSEFTGVLVLVAGAYGMVFMGAALVDCCFSSSFSRALMAFKNPSHALNAGELQHKVSAIKAHI